MNRNGCCALLLLIMMVLLFPSAVGAEDTRETTTVRVGIFSLGRFQGFDETGKPCGYTVDYLNKLKELTHWSYEFVPCANWVEATALLEQGKIDLLAPAQKIPPLQARFDYATFPMGTEYAAVYTLADRSDLLYEDFTRMRNLKYGAAEHSTFTKKFLQEYAPAAGFVPEISLYPNTTALFEALFSGKVDAIVTNIMFADEKIRLLAKFSPLSVHYITQKGNTALLSQLDEAQSSIYLKQPAFEAELMGKYFPVYNNTQFTYAETSFIKELPPIVIGYPEGYLPISFTNAKTGGFAGIAKDLLEMVAENLGTSFRYLPLPLNKTLTAADIQNLGIHALVGAEALSLNIPPQDFRTTQPLFQSDLIFIAQHLPDQASSADHPSTVAVINQHSEQTKRLLAKYPYMKPLSCNSTEGCFEAVLAGKAQLLVGERYVVDQLLSRPRYAKLQIAPIQGIPGYLRLSGVLTHQNENHDAVVANELFISILDKAINKIDTQALNTCVIRNTIENQYAFTTTDLLDLYAWQLLGAFVLIAIIVGLFIWNNINKQRHLETIAAKNIQLGEAIEQARSANAAKTDFLSRMSHDIRTPLNAIIGYLTLSTPKESKDCLLSHIQKSELAAKYLLAIINDVLDMAAIESGRIKIAHDRFDFKQLLTSLSSMFFSQAQAKGITFETNLKQVTEDFLIGDRLRLNQICLNLLSNAIKFTPKGGSIFFTVQQEALRDDTVFMTFSVQDTGEGMEPAFQERLFHPFEQENARVAAQHGGTGLGLAIVKSFTELMGGAIQVTSEKGKGSTFSVNLHFGRDTSTEVSPQRNSFTRLHALVVDDEQNACEYMRALLDRCGVTCKTVNSGKEALTAIQQAVATGDMFDLCLMDWQMPCMDGIETVREIRKLTTKPLPVIIVTSYDFSQVQEQGHQAGVTHFIQKPVFQSTLFDLLVSTYGKYDPAASEDTIKDHDFGGIRVLVAEDNIVNIEVAKLLLETVNIQVDSAVNGAEAVKLFSEAPAGTYALILMDIQMPEMDGYEATQAIRASSHPEAKDIPIIAMTANAFAEDISKALACGMNNHVAKPVDAEELFRTIRLALKNRKK